MRGRGTPALPRAEMFHVEHGEQNLTAAPICDTREGVAPLSFHRPELDDGDALRRIVAGARAVNSDLAWVNLLLLAPKYDTEIALEDGVLFKGEDILS